MGENGGRRLEISFFRRPFKLFTRSGKAVTHLAPAQNAPETRSAAWIAAEGRLRMFA